jgi:hypothetical protein
MKRTLLPMLLCFLPASLFCGNVARDGQQVGYLKVNVVPDRAGLFVDGRYFGPAARYGSARKYLMTPGKHEVRLVDPRYEESTATVDIAPGKTATISEALTPKPAPTPPFATLKVICSPMKLAAVMLNDHYAGHVAEFDGAGQGLQVSPGTYQVRIDVAGGESMLWQQVTLEAGKTTVVQWDN